MKGVEKPIATYRWIDRVWELTNWNSKNYWSFWENPWNAPQINKEKPKDHNIHVTGWTWTHKDLDWLCPETSPNTELKCTLDHIIKLRNINAATHMHLHCLANKTWWSKQYCQVEPDMSTGTAAKLQLPGNLIDDESWHIRPKNTTNACFVFEETESFSISKGGPECTWGVLHRESWSVPWKQAERRDSQLCRKLGTLMEHRKAWRMLRWGRGHPPIASSSSTSPQSPRRHPGSSSSPY